MNSEYCAIVISYREYREHDAIIKLLDENGTISSLIARGVQKINSKNAAGCQQFTYGRYFVTSANPLFCILYAVLNACGHIVIFVKIYICKA